MVLAQSWTDAERLVVVYYLSRGFSRNGILKLLQAKFGRDHSDDLIEQMLDNINLKEDQGGRVLPYDTQRQGQEWDLDAVDVVIAGLRGQLASDLADQLMSIQTSDETTVLQVYSQVFHFLFAPR